MIGILLISHGNFAMGIKHSSEMFFSENIEAFESLVFTEDSVLDEFEAQIKEKISRMNDGSGVVVLADMLGGTPANKTIPLLCDDVFLIAGFNFNLLIDLLIKRKTVSDIHKLNIHEMLDEAREGMLFVNEYMEVL